MHRRHRKGGGGISTPAGAFRVVQAYLNTHHPGVNVTGLREDQPDYAPVLEGESTPPLFLDKATGEVWTAPVQVFLARVNAMTPVQVTPPPH